MRKLSALGSLVLWAGSLAALPPADADRVPALIAQLGSPDFTDREAASKELERLGGPALDALQAACASTDMEVARRAALLHEKIARRVDHERTLAPSRVELNLTDVPLSDVAAELEKQSGYRLLFASPELSSKKVTLKTAGRVSFWEATALICEKGSLEVESATPGKPQPITTASSPPAGTVPQLARKLPPGGAIPDVQQELLEMAQRRQAAIDQMRKQVEDRLKEVEKAAADGQKQKVIEQLRQQNAEMQKILQLLAEQQSRQVVANRSRPTSATFPGTILLRSRAGTAQPVSLTGAVRIESVPITAGLSALLPRNNVVALLNPLAEPRLTWEKVESVRVTKAVDSAGRHLLPVASVTQPVALQERQIEGGRIVVGFDGGVNLVPERKPAPGSTLASSNQALIRLTCDPDQIPKSLQELEGVIRAQVRTGVEEIAAVSDFKNASTVSVNGVTLKVASVTPVADSTDRHELDISVEYNPAQVQVADAGTPNVTERVINQGGGRVIVRQQMAGGVIVIGGNPQNGWANPSPPSTPAAFGLRVLDADGKPLTLSVTKSVRQFWPTGIVTDQIRLTARGSNPPAKVTFTGERSKSVEVPFRFTNLSVTAGAGPITAK